MTQRSSSHFMLLPGVPLEECPTWPGWAVDPEDPAVYALLSSFTASTAANLPSATDHVPLLVKFCTSIVEEKGLEIVGIYRVPGNSAAVTHLTELVNNHVEEWSRLDDPRWNDVNVVSSLLKSFFRKLPDPLFTLANYQVFIEASKIEDAVQRLASLKYLIHRNLPPSHFETLRLMANHLCKVAERSEVNKMSLQNLAIVFGPTLVRASDDNMMSMVTDMSHQCKIIESVLSNCAWFFKDDPSSSDGSGGCEATGGVAAVLPASAAPTGSTVGIDDVMDLEHPPFPCHDSHHPIMSNTPDSQELLKLNLQKLEKSGQLQVGLAILTFEEVHVVLNSSDVFVPFQNC